MANEGHICSRCGKRSATILLTEFVDGTPVEHHLCEKCYAEQDEGPLPQAILGRLLAAVAPALAEMRSHTCPACGMNYLEFRQGLTLGCQHGYGAFEEQLEEILQQIHGATWHTGKVPPGMGRDTAVRNRIKSLRERQGKAVAEENYELAAELRDQILELQQNGPDAPEK